MSFKPFQADYIGLVTAISKELTRQVPNLQFDPVLYTRLIDAANLICDECRRERVYATSYMTPEQWLGSDDVGPSSGYMLSVLIGASSEPDGPIPSDPDELGRCIRMIKACKLSHEIPRLYSMGNRWRRIAENWERLCDMYQANKYESIYTFLNYK
jgi:hypothetical protein